MLHQLPACVCIENFRMLTSRFLSKRTCFRFIHSALKKLDVPSVDNYSRQYLHTTRYAAGLSQFKKELQIQTRERVVPDYPHNDPEDAILSHPDFFKVKDTVTLRDLYKARVHYGHKAGSRNEYMREFLYGSRLDIDIFDLEQTLPLLHDALNFIAHIAYRQGVILFISRNVQTVSLVESTAKQCGEYSHCRRWRMGLFTNAPRHFSDEIRMPDLAIFLQTKNDAFQEHEAVMECAKMCIPTIGIVDSNCDPRLITYPIPGNDDSPVSIQLYLNLFREAIKRGKDQLANEQKMEEEAKNKQENKATKEKKDESVKEKDKE